MCTVGVLFPSFFLSLSTYTWGNFKHIITLYTNLDHSHVLHVNIYKYQLNLDNFYDHPKNFILSVYCTIEHEEDESVCCVVEKNERDSNSQFFIILLPWKTWFLFKFFTERQISHQNFTFLTTFWMCLFDHVVHQLTGCVIDFFDDSWQLAIEVNWF